MANIGRKVTVAPKAQEKKWEGYRFEDLRRVEAFKASYASVLNMTMYHRRIIYGGLGAAKTLQKENNRYLKSKTSSPVDLLNCRRSIATHFGTLRCLLGFTGPEQIVAGCHGWLKLESEYRNYTRLK